jgi:hypothetical protein
VRSVSRRRRSAGVTALLSGALVVLTSFALTGEVPNPQPSAQAEGAGPEVDTSPHGPPEAGGRELDQRMEPLVGPVDAYSVVSGPNGLADGVVDAVDRIDGVRATTRVRSSTTGLFGSITAEGVARDEPPAGMRIPVNALSLDPATYLSALAVDVDPAEAALVSGLRPGTVLLSAAAARLRELGPGATVDLGQARGLVVAGIVADVVARGSEFLVHQDDVEDIGLARRESLLVRSVVGAGAAQPSQAALEEAFDSALSSFAQEDLRVWHATRGVPLVLSTLAVKERFGEFAFRLRAGEREVEIDRRFVEEWITVEQMPVLGPVRCHRLIMDDLRAAIEESVAAGLSAWLAPDRYGGCFNARRIGVERENLSRHAWGIAIDLNVDFALPGGGPVPPDEFLEIWGRHGFRWGGDFTSPDNHHYEWVGAMAEQRPARGGA